MGTVDIEQLALTLIILIMGFLIYFYIADLINLKKLKNKIKDEEDNFLNEFKIILINEVNKDKNFLFWFATFFAIVCIIFILVDIIILTIILFIYVLIIAIVYLVFKVGKHVKILWAAEAKDFESLLLKLEIKGYEKEFFLVLEEKFKKNKDKELRKALVEFVYYSMNS